MLNLPKFNFSDCSIQSDEQLDAELAKSAGNSKFFQPGRHEVKVKSVEFRKINERDPNWADLEVVLEGTGEKTIKDFISVPLKDVKFRNNGKESLWPFKKVKQFCEAHGVELSISALTDGLNAVFRNPALVGAAVVAEIGYRKGYVKYMGKRDNGEKIYQLIDKDGNAVRSGADQPAVEFADFDAALNYAEDQKIPVDKYVSVLKYEKSAAGGALTQNSNW